jgi:hypothetical protein
VLHLDADVAESAYADVGPEIERIATQQKWLPLPCHVDCPPPEASAIEVRQRLLSWARLNAPGPKTVLCIPSKVTDAWLAAALFEDGHRLLGNLECNLNLEAQLGALPKSERLKKSGRQYRDCANRITKAWGTVRERCSQADRFSNEVEAALLSRGN